MQIPPQVAQLMLETDREQTRALFRSFVEHTTSQGWGFSYTDKIGAHCKALYGALSDFEIRADLIYCVVEVGVEHNRFHVMDIAESLLEYRKPVGESVAVAERLKGASPAIREWVRERISPAKLHPAIVDAVKQ